MTTEHPGIDEEGRLIGQAPIAAVEKYLAMDEQEPDLKSIAHFSVIIPFFQREPGLLRGAVESVVRQDFSGSCQMIIVDDGSLVSAESEIQDLLDSHDKYPIKLIKQENAGVGAARNRALEEIVDTDVVVFLDSDDEFVLQRFQTIQIAFENGADFFFEDTIDPYSGQSSFEKNGSLSNALNAHTRISDGIYKYEGNPVDLLVPLGAFGANSMAYRWKGREHLRFETKYGTCDDVIFAARLLKVSTNVVVSTRRGVILGKGVNISRGPAWGSEPLIRLLLNICQVSTEIERVFKLTRQQSSRMRRELRKLDAGFMENVIVLLVKKHKIMLAKVARYILLRPHVILVVPKVTYSLIRARLSHR